MRTGVALWALLAAVAAACAPAAERSEADGAATDPGAAPVAERAGSPVDGVTIEYLAHASFLVRSPEGVELLLDPYASRVWIGYAFPAGIVPDAVLITHPHYDHDAGRYRGMPLPWGSDVQVIDGPGVYELGDVRVIAVEGKHADPYGMEFGQLNTLMKVEVAGVSIVHLGDNGPLTPENAAALGRVDVLMAPADSQYHILSEDQLAEIRAALRPRLLVPMHYRIPALEPEPGSPGDLGDLGPWLEGRPRVEHVGGSTVVLGPDDLPDEETILVFEHSPRVPSPPRSSASARPPPRAVVSPP